LIQAPGGETAEEETGGDEGSTQLGAANGCQQALG
jgi:hypothetical protein